MKLSVFSAKAYDRHHLDRAAQAQAQPRPRPRPSSPVPIDITYHDFPLSPETTALAAGADAVCVFVNDTVSAAVVDALADLGVGAVLLRCAGFNNVDLAAARRRRLVVANVPAYAPDAVAEFAVALIQTLNRRTHRAYNRVREGNFSLDGLLGHTLRGKTVGIVGTGRIGLATAALLAAFGCRVLAHDPVPRPDALARVGGTYVSLDDLLPACDILSLHCPLTDATRHLIDDAALARVKPGLMLVNTSRGGLVDTHAVIRALKTNRLGALALDVYEAEGALFYDDHSADIIQDDVLMRLMTFPNVLVCGHQAFFTVEALTEIAESTMRNLQEFAASGSCQNSLTKDPAPQGREPLPVRNV
ncbi:d-isomer specific 2-hydroxyacid dehydrogenase, NAD binding domain-containing protein [Hirsutella rhossiliensis]|uniref:D-isomer specific 2-hydroxyacid dehydrogenase, NAD binding domain-containing protein n=1 Tax=Hirsutella rhossiliensis TaxID=111463 RepID=A0A9P8SHG7_9HYPO|nr:d-isomer specific 2-hydroxyacid dehydrogenase, NAD binding domain-containing protein [Hirsutella rhossiliensis]KAH0962821.1 d-isomer specific 2-hydroxyacid dehydrogenase, NAD binding domain-containing protein [Hirsutella rhossiliensis]